MEIMDSHSSRKQICQSRKKQVFEPAIRKTGGRSGSTKETEKMGD